MPSERVIPSDQPKTVVTATILSGGTEVPKTCNVLSIVINKEVNRIPSAIVVISDGDPARQTSGISNEAWFEPGKELEIKLGYRASEETAFKGIVVKHSIKTREKSSVLIIECRDKAYKLTSSCKNGYHIDKKDSEVIEEMIGNYGIDNDVEATSIKHRQMIQYNSSDWDFILCRADVNGLICIANDGKLSVKKPDLDAASILTVQYGATVHEMDVEMDARLQYKSVKGTSWNYTDQELLSNVESEEPTLPAAGNLDGAQLAGLMGDDEFTLLHSGRVEEPELQHWVNAKMLKHRLAKIRGQVKIDGTVAVAPGNIIELKGAGERFEGKLFVSGVRQQYEKGNWHTSIQFGINPEWLAQTYNVQQPLSGALLPAINGLQIGIVTKLEQDPDGENRIMVRIPVIHAQDEGAWCRVSSLDAGNERGMFFLPEVDDEVIVGFINNDPRNGVVLGMVNSSAKPAPLTASDDNHEKGYQSRSKMKLMFNDDKKIVNIETPGGHKVEINEDEKKIHLEDLNGNKIILNEDGITIESIKDIKMKSAADTKIEAVNMEIKGSAQTKVEGGSGAELSSGATTNVKGSMVNIN